MKSSRNHYMLFIGAGGSVFWITLFGIVQISGFGSPWWHGPWHYTLVGVFFACYWFCFWKRLQGEFDSSEDFARAKDTQDPAILDIFQKVLSWRNRFMAIEVGLPVLLLLIVANVFPGPGPMPLVAASVYVLVVVIFHALFPWGVQASGNGSTNSG